MGEGKYIEEVYRWVKQLPDNDPEALEHLIGLANRVAYQHPIWYERFRISSKFVRGWRWVISRKWFARSERRDGSSENAGT